MNPTRQVPETRDFSNVAWIQFEDYQHKSFIGIFHAEKIAKLFVEFGDYNVMRDRQDSCFIEFYSYDEELLGKEGKIEDVIAIL